MREMYGVGERNRRARVVGSAMLHSMRSLVLIVVVSLVATACGSVASEQATVELAAPSPMTTPTVVPSPTASAGGTAPISAGAVPEAGVVSLTRERVRTVRSRAARRHDAPEVGRNHATGLRRRQLVGLRHP